MLLVRPNTRKMRAFINSPSERPAGWRDKTGFGLRAQWNKVIVAIAIAGGAVIATMVLAPHW